MQHLIFIFYNYIHLWDFKVQFQLERIIMKNNIKEQLEAFTNTDTFWISYYAKKHGKIIKRFGTYTKPDTDIKGKHFISKGNDVFVYWDFNAPANDNGNKWRMATNPLKVEVA